MNTVLLANARLVLAAILAIVIFWLHHSGVTGGADAVIYVLLIMLIADAGHTRFIAASKRKAAQIASEASEKALDRAQVELEQRSRAAILGEISGSIAHEINQPLSAIKTSAQAGRRWLARQPPDLDEVDAALGEVVSASELADQVVRRVRMLLGHARMEREPICVEGVIRDVVQLYRRTLIDQGVQLTLNLGGEGSIILADRILLQQVLLNIITNSIQALEATPAESRGLSVTSEIAHHEIMIRITDTGPGIAEGMEHRLFKAFATTKADGMGLGLAMCRSIVTAHDGSISITNDKSGKGAQVTISFPLHQGELQKPL